MNNQNKKTTIRGITKIKNAWKNHDVTINQVELENGDISGTFEGELNMIESKISNNQMLKYLDKKFDAIDKKFDAIDKKFDAIDKKLDLIINCPTIQREMGISLEHLKEN